MKGGSDLLRQLILVINPGSTSTKLAVYRDSEELHSVSLHHSTEELAQFQEIVEQRSFRERVIIDWLDSLGIELNALTAIVARGGLLAPMKGGTYLINNLMVRQLEEGIYGKHASNLAALIAFDLGQRLAIPAYIVDPVVVDEMEPVAKISGSPGIERLSIFHALNQKASAKKAAELLGRPVGELNLIVAHLGGGISIGVHRRGQVIDVNNALSGEGPFSPERSGGLPTTALIDYFFAKRKSKEDLIRLFCGQSGTTAYLGTNDLRDITKRIEAGDAKALFYCQAMAYQIAKEIGRLSTVVLGKVDQIVLTGGLAFNPGFVEEIKQYVEFIAPLTVLPGENELEALAWGALRVLRKEEPARHYLGEEVS